MKLNRRHLRKRRAEMLESDRQIRGRAYRYLDGFILRSGFLYYVLYQGRRGLLVAEARYPTMSGACEHIEFANTRATVAAAQPPEGT